jgi:5-formyltetrahydrofolate cyclo-ligase
MPKRSSSDLTQRKKQARIEALARRNALDDLLRAEKSALITQRLLNLELFQKARCLFIYVSVHSEADTHKIIQAALVQQKTVCVPFVDMEKKEMIACAITDPGRDLHAGMLGIPEPDRRSCPLVAACDIDLVIVPGLEFTVQGYRIGYGGGFYDRFLSACSGISCALAFEEQIVESLPFDPACDRAVSRIITDQREIDCRTCRD